MVLARRPNHASGISLHQTRRNTPRPVSRPSRPQIATALPSESQHTFPLRAAQPRDWRAAGARPLEYTAPLRLFRPLDRAAPHWTASSRYGRRVRGSTTRLFSHVAQDQSVTRAALARCAAYCIPPVVCPTPHLHDSGANPGAHRRRRSLVAGQAALKAVRGAHK